MTLQVDNDMPTVSRQFKADSVARVEDTLDRLIKAALVRPAPTRRTNTVSRDRNDGTEVAAANVDELVESTIARARRGGLTSTHSRDLPNFKVENMQKWTGQIVAIDDPSFTVELSSLDESESPSVYADFDLKVLKPETDISVGDVVYVTSRHVSSGPGLPPNVTVSVRLRKLGRWSESEIDEQRNRARQRLARIAQYID